MWTMLISTILGALTNMVPVVMNYFDKKNERAFNMQMSQLQFKYAEMFKGMDNALGIIKANTDDIISARTHDAAVDGGKFINAWRAAMRPAVCSLFVLLFIFAKVAGLIALYRGNNAFVQGMALLWDEGANLAFSAILGFLFGGRAADKYLVSSAVGTVGQMGQTVTAPAKK